MVELPALIKGYKEFYKKYFENDKALYKSLVKGQSPKTLMIACSDSRVDPSIITNADPGDIFVIRNVANLVPEYEPKRNYPDATGSALEFAIKVLNVENIIILGHSHCAGIKTLLDRGRNVNDLQAEFIPKWVNIAARPRERVLKYEDYSEEEQNFICEKEAMIVSLENLMTYPWIRKKVNEKNLILKAWHFCLETGKVTEFKSNSKQFTELT